MLKEKFEEIVSKLKYERNKWHIFHEIEGIVLNSGRGIYPNWKHTRFLISNDGKLYINYGDVKPYGARLSGLLYASGDYTALTFTMTDKGIPIENSNYYGEWFRQPKVGDYIRVTEGLNKVVGESMIRDIKPSLNSIIVDMWLPIKGSNKSRISFYDPKMLNDNRDRAVHGTMEEGIYVIFEPYTFGYKTKQFGNYHEEIKIKDIREINLRVGSDYYNKTYKLD
jgi:hypothetical protein